jgi:hypothetical protein
MCCCCTCACKDKASISCPPADPIEVPPPNTTTFHTFVKEEIWNLTIPETDPKTKNPKVIKLPELRNYQSDFFSVLPEGIFMAAPVDGATTPNSKYPRCEFREVNPDGSLAKWDGSKGSHTMKVVTSVRMTPKNKPELCIMQVHDSKDDVFMVRFEKDQLVISGVAIPKGKKILTKKVGLNEDIVIDFKVSNGKAILTVNGDITQYPFNYKGCYFKTGAYVQSNRSFDDKGQLGAVLLKEVSISH